jgi:hypothetical protein
MAKRTNNYIQTLHRKLKTEKHKPHQNFGETSGAPEGQSGSTPLVAPVVLPVICHEWGKNAWLLRQTEHICDTDIP